MIQSEDVLVRRCTQDMVLKKYKWFLRQAVTQKFIEIVEINEEQKDIANSKVVKLSFEWSINLDFQCSQQTSYVQLVKLSRRYFHHIFSNGVTLFSKHTHTCECNPNNAVTTGYSSKRQLLMAVSIPVSFCFSQQAHCFFL